MYHRIVVALDGSPVAERVLPYVEPLAEKFGATLILVRSAVPPSPSVLAAEGAAGMIESIEESFAEDQRDAATYVGDVARRVRAHGLNAQTECPDGDAAEQILACADELEADLIAMTTHGRGGLGRLMLGSVADAVVQRAPCPVLLVRVEEEDESDRVPATAATAAAVPPEPRATVSA
jgi:nucleotide-binding universal stress UspA family protein